MIDCEFWDWHREYQTKYPEFWMSQTGEQLLKQNWMHAKYTMRAPTSALKKHMEDIIMQKIKR